MGELDLDSLESDFSARQEHEADSNDTASKKSALTPETLRKAILAYVAESEYDTAIEELKDFLNSEFDYPSFKNRSIRYINHSIDLINAIRAKKNFPGAGSLTRAKSQELKERTKSHYNELDQTLKRIERVETQLKIEDVKSTLWVVKSVSYSLIIILIVGLSMDITGGLFETTTAVLEDFVLKTLDWIFSLF